MAQVIQTPKGPRWIDSQGVYDHDPSTLPTPPAGGYLTPPPYDPTDPANIAAWQQAVATNPNYYGALAPTLMPGLAPLAPQAPIAVSGGSIDPLTGAFTQTPAVVVAASAAGGGVSASSSFNLSNAFSSLTSGSILGIPTIYVVGGIAAYFLFFQKKGRR